MHFSRSRFRPLPLVYRVLGIILVVGFVLIGLVGLILPIIPGVVFLLLAVYVLTRISRRAAAYAHNQPWFNRHMRHLNAADSLSVGERCKLGFLVMARSVVNGIEWCVAAIKGRDKAS
ncbi:MAG: DUF454 family protein [Gammaproteobacteria bacterium]|nr:DUF454 family protein [Gammaproteobacteria bacterium]